VLTGCVGERPAPLMVLLIVRALVFAPAQHFEYLSAKFGPMLTASDPPIVGKLVMASPEDGCMPPNTPLENSRVVAGNIVVIRRGRCMFPDKVLAAQFSRAVAVIIASTDLKIVRLDAPPESPTASIKIPSVMAASSICDVVPRLSTDTATLARFLVV
jgi:hypothetical protein